MQLQNYEKVKILGQGTYGKCYLVLDRVKGVLCVLKQVEIVGMSQQQIAETMKEAQILQALDHPNIVKSLGSFISKEGYLNILMNYADGGDLSQKIKETKGNHFSENQILNWFTQACLAIKHVHDRKIVHRDLKTQNIFLTKEGDVKLGDFGIAKPLQLTLQKIKSVVGTPYYMSPQICENKEYSFKTDIWSLGVILLELCLLKPPFDANSLPALALKISKGQYNPIPKQYSRDLRKLIAEMLQVDPNRRPTIHQILKYPLIKSKIDHLLPKEIRDLEFSHTVLHSQNFMDRPSNSRGLFIQLSQEDQSPREDVISPRNGGNSFLSGPSKLNQIGLKKGDSNSLREKKGNKRGQLLRRQISQPNLTPKNHSKIENQRKVMVKNGSLAHLERKKTSQKEGAFKKKVKPSMDLFNEVEEIHFMKNEILQLQEQFSYSSKEIPKICQQCLEIPDESIYESADEQQEETLRETMERIIANFFSEGDFQKNWQICEKQGGHSPSVTHGGLFSIYYGLRTFS